jgi:hypothetical protein
MAQNHKYGNRLSVSNFSLEDENLEVSEILQIATTRICHHKKNT